MKRYSLGVLCVVHAAFLVIAIVPPQSRSGGIVGDVLGFYQHITGSGQEWDMFETIPALHRLDVGLMEVRDGTVRRNAGVILPDFSSCPVPEDARTYTLFHRMIWDVNGPEYANAYLRRAAEALKNRSDAPDSIALQMDAWHTRSLLGVKSLGEIAVNKIATYGPVPAAGEGESKQP